ncbi:MAG: 23S rRNA (pseudouridine(1915)-N(3))-methyltransferase RlmH [Spirochaetales bacterium]
MITFNIISVGTLKEKYLVDATKEYIKRLEPFAKVNLIEVRESALSNNASASEINKAKQIEAQDLKQRAKGFLVALEIKGKSMTSEEFSKKIDELATSGVSEISFIIGGSNGLDDEFSRGCNLQLSFSSFTFPHQLMRVIMLEQLYRAMCIINNKTYHK